MSTILKAIRSKCLDCCCNQIVEVKECILTRCVLHPYRMGKNPFSKNKGNPGNLKRGSEK